MKCIDLRDRYGLPRLCLAGGVALNVAANSRIVRESGFDEVFIQPAAGDDGQALGKLLYRLHNDFGVPRVKQWDTFRGPEYSMEEAEEALNQHRAKVEWVAFSDHEALARDVAKQLKQQRIVALWNGRSELGPRALGNRSILADPRTPGMRHVLNERVKHREFFQPFALSVRAEDATRYFDLPGESPYMLLVGHARESAVRDVPAALHVDGTSRVHTVTVEREPLLYAILTACSRAGMPPAVINTSFNDKGEPMVETPVHAIRAFLKMSIDRMVLGSFMIRRTRAAASQMELEWRGSE